MTAVLVHGVPETVGVWGPLQDHLRGDVVTLGAGIPASSSSRRVIMYLTGRPVAFDQQAPVPHAEPRRRLVHRPAAGTAPSTWSTSTTS